MLVTYFSKIKKSAWFYLLHFICYFRNEKKSGASIILQWLLGAKQKMRSHIAPLAQQWPTSQCEMRCPQFSCVSKVVNWSSTDDTDAVTQLFSFTVLHVNLVPRVLSISPETTREEKERKRGYEVVLHVIF